jgi:hypothetical protein
MRLPCLFYYLPCNFKRKTQTNDLLPVFQAGQELYQLSPGENMAKVRTGIQLTKPKFCAINFA